MGAGRIAAHRARRRPEQHRRHRRPVGALNVGYPVRQVGVRRRHRRRRQHIAVGNQRTVFRHAVDIRRSRRHVVDDGHVQAGGGARAVRVGDLYREADREAVLAIVARAVGKRVVLQRVAVVHRAEPGRRVEAEAGHHQRARRIVEDRLRHRPAQRHNNAADRQPAEAVGRAEGEDAAVGQAVRRGVRTGRLAGPARRKIVLVDHQLATRHIQAGDRHPVIGALDGDGQRRRRNIAVGVGDRVVEHLRQRLPRGQRLNQRIGVVQRIGVGAVGSQNQRAMGAGRIAAHRARRRPEQHRRHRRPVGALNVGYPVRQVGVRRRHRRRRQHIAVGNQRTVFRHAVDIRRSRRHVVDDGHVQAGGGARAVRVGDLYREADREAVLAIVARAVGKRVVLQRVAVGPPCRARSPRRS